MMLASTKPLRAPSARASAPRGRCATRVMAAYERIKAEAVDNLFNNKGYTLLDVRTPEENANSSKLWFVNIPVGFETPDGPKLNGRFGQMIEKKFPNKMSRVIIACDEGADRSEIAAEAFKSLQYSESSIKILDGGLNDYLSKFPPTEKDIKPKWKLVGEQTGVRYSYRSGNPDDFDDGA